MNDSQIAENNLRKFCSEMHIWEKNLYVEKNNLSASQDSINAIDRQARIDLEKILNKWAIENKYNRERLFDLGCSSPPTYDPENDSWTSTISEGLHIYIIIKQNTGIKSEFRFTMTKLNDNWLIKKKEYLNYKDKWIQSIL